MFRKCALAPLRMTQFNTTSRLSTMTKQSTILDSSVSNAKSERNDESNSNWSKWTGKNAWKSGLLGLAGFGSFFIGSVVYKYGPPHLDEQGNEIIDKYTDMPKAKGYVLRGFRELLDFNQSIKDPISDKLLPDPVKPPYYQPPYTIVLELNGLLVHPDWKFRSGWRFKKRPALEVFLQQLHPFYEVVVFSSEGAMAAAPILMQLDSEGQYFHHRLFREATRYRNGKHIKDLSCLNRDLSKVIVVDWNADSVSMQSENAFLVKRWHGDDTDTDLLDLAAFLRMVAMGQVEDVRPVLKHYASFPDPLAEFRLRNAQLIELNKEKEMRADAKRKGMRNQLTSSFKSIQKQ